MHPKTDTTARTGPNQPMRTRAMRGGASFSFGASDMPVVPLPDDQRRGPIGPPCCARRPHDKNAYLYDAMTR